MDFPEIVVVTFNQKILNIVQNMDDVVEISELNGGYPIPIYKINYKSKSIAVYQTIIGGAGSAGLLEEVIAKGEKKFIFFGSCGTLDKELPAGHLKMFKKKTKIIAGLMSIILFTSVFCVSVLALDREKQLNDF